MVYRCQNKLQTSKNTHFGKSYQKFKNHWIQWFGRPDIRLLNVLMREIHIISQVNLWTKDKFLWLTIIGPGYMLSAPSILMFYQLYDQNSRISIKYFIHAILVDPYKLSGCAISLINNSCSLFLGQIKYISDTYLILIQPVLSPFLICWFPGISPFFWVATNQGLV